MYDKLIGGIGFEDAVKFQLKILMGTQYGRVVKAERGEDIVIACLRLAWNDAFRHVTRNVAKDLEKQLRKIHNDNKLTLDGYICEKILRSDVVLETFYAYAKADCTAAKIKVINDALEHAGLREAFREVKKITDDDKALCFGHFQKLYNMALKLYLCLCQCSDILGISDRLDDRIKEEYFVWADCPVDSIVLRKLDEKEHCADSPHLLKEKLRVCREECGLKKYEELKGSKIGQSPGNDFTVAQYQMIQNVIGEVVAAEHGAGKGNLYFDFAYWKD